MCFLGIEPTTFCAADAMLYHWATGGIQITCLLTHLEIRRQTSKPGRRTLVSSHTLCLSRGHNTWRYVCFCSLKSSEEALHCTRQLRHRYCESNARRSVIKYTPKCELQTAKYLEKELEYPWHKRPSKSVMRKQRSVDGSYRVPPGILMCLFPNSTVGESYF